jgi:hypothetical protein
MQLDAVQQPSVLIFTASQLHLNNEQLKAISDAMN